jgi:amidohydrolase
MPIVNRVADLQPEIQAWRRDIHQHPELLYDVHRTAAFVAERLREFGCDEVATGLGRTGVVGVIKGRQPAPKGDIKVIGLRADMDALPIEEATNLAYASKTPGKMHACGHDGHTAMLLGAARYLAKARNFDGTVHFIFQPAEEGGGGGRVMVEEGLFDKFPVDAVYGMHNAPRTAVGKFFTRPGPVMAASANFDLTISGRGSHAARPETGFDAVVAACHVVAGLQSIVSRNVSAFESAVVSTTQIHAGDAYNIIPEDVVIRGNCRAYKTEVMSRLEQAIRRVAEGVASGFGAGAKLDFHNLYPPLVNHAAEAAIACDAAAAVVGEENVDRNGPPRMASEDFSYMLQARPGAFIFIGNGDGSEGSCDVHNPNYDFNDAILPLGASFFARLIEINLPRRR